MHQVYLCQIVVESKLIAYFSAWFQRWAISPAVNLNWKQTYLKMNSNHFRKKVSLVRWVLILIWFIPVLHGRIPVYDESYVEVDGIVEVAADGTMVVRYPARPFGFPFKFMEITDYSNGISTRKYILGRCFLNILLVGFTVAGIVVVDPKLSLRYSIRSWFLLTAGMAVVILIIQSPNITFRTFLKLMYFIPLFAVAIVAVLNFRGYLFRNFGPGD